MPKNDTEIKQGKQGKDKKPKKRAQELSIREQGNRREHFRLSNNRKNRKMIQEGDLSSTDLRMFRAMKAKSRSEGKPTRASKSEKKANKKTLGQKAMRAIKGPNRGHGIPDDAVKRNR